MTVTGERVKNWDERGGEAEEEGAGEERGKGKARRINMIIMIINVNGERGREIGININD